MTSKIFWISVLTWVVSLTVFFFKSPPIQVIPLSTHYFQTLDAGTLALFQNVPGFAFVVILLAIFILFSQRDFHRLISEDKLALLLIQPVFYVLSAGHPFLLITAFTLFLIYRLDSWIGLVLFALFLSIFIGPAVCVITGIILLIKNWKSSLSIEMMLLILVIASVVPVIGIHFTEYSFFKPPISELDLSTYLLVIPFGFLIPLFLVQDIQLREVKMVFILIGIAFTLITDWLTGSAFHLAFLILINFYLIIRLFSAKGIKGKKIKPIQKWMSAIGIFTVFALIFFSTQTHRAVVELYLLLQGYSDGEWIKSFYTIGIFLIAIVFLLFILSRDIFGKWIYDHLKYIIWVFLLLYMGWNGIVYPFLHQSAINHSINQFSSE